jgi:multidrug transporter EmrE-like cation transporter
MGTIKNVSMGIYPRFAMWIVTVLYMIQPWIFLKGLNFTSMTVLNLSWDLLSDILVTVSGLLYFRESLTEYKLIGVLFALLAITLFALDGASDIGSAASS